MDVESAINLFFKGVLLFPIFLFAGYIGLMMMKHMIMHGLPVMNNATPEQQENIRERDSQVGLPSSQGVKSEERVSVSESESQVSEYGGLDPELKKFVEKRRREMDPRMVAFEDGYEKFSECLSVVSGNELLRTSGKMEEACGGEPRKCHYGLEENYGAGEWCDGYSANGRVRL